jgi:phage gp36-like protein
MSTFITKDDMQSLVKRYKLDQILEDDDSILDEAEKEAIAEVESYLFQTYDTTAEFAKVDDNRNTYLLTLCKRVTLWYVYQRIEDELIPERVEENYAATIATLETVQSGDRALKLDRLTETVGEETVPKTKFRWGGNKRRTHEY